MCECVCKIFTKLSFGGDTDDGSTNGEMQRKGKGNRAIVCVCASVGEAVHRLFHIFTRRRLLALRRWFRGMRLKIAWACADDDDDCHMLS